MLISVSTPYALMRQALVDRKRVSLWFDGDPREICPHSIGTRDGEPRVLGWQFGGISSRRLPDWRCMPIGKISDIRIMPGSWVTGGSHSRKQSCITHVDIDVTCG
jgi:hypothetical protein